MRAPTFDEILQFFRLDGWEEDHNSGHNHWKKVLADGTELRSHVSFSGRKSPGPARWVFILRTQLHITADAFWVALHSQRPVPRPNALEATEERLSLELLLKLTTQVGLPYEEAVNLSKADAIRILNEHYSTPTTEES